jgi:hypothetical protein
LGHAVSQADTENMRKELADQKVENVFERRRAPAPPRVERTPSRSNVSTISFKRDRPQPEVTTTAVEAPVEDSPVASGISFEEAMKLGLVANVTPDSSPPPETPVESDVSGGLTPDKFEEALLKGLFGE